MALTQKQKLLPENDTIVAKATAGGKGGVGIVRVSGTAVKNIAKAILGQELKPKIAYYLSFLDPQSSEEIDKGIVLFFAAPNSLTGEDIIEFQGHGGPVVMEQMLRTVIALGARQARPGEFLERAFLNNKIDLLQAEAVHDLIHANSEAAARAAMRSMQGLFSKRVHSLVNSFIELRMFVEAAIDFPDEEIEFLQEGDVLTKLQTLQEDLNLLITEAAKGIRLSEGLRVVIAGKPNAGKSSLLNTLCGAPVAIVTNIPGTTRDVLREEISLEGLNIELVDTAGIREEGDCIEQEGIRRARQELLLADHVLWVVDASQANQIDGNVPGIDVMATVDSALDLNSTIQLLQKYVQEIKQEIFREEKERLLPGKCRVILIFNKIDLSLQEPKVLQVGDDTVIYLSVQTGMGLPLLRQHLMAAAEYNVGENTFMARRRHLDALTRAKLHLEIGSKQLETGVGFEILAEELRLGQICLDGITGRFSADDLLGKIFSEFCIGK